MPDFTMLREMEQETQLLLIQQASVTISDSGRSANSNRKHKCDLGLRRLYFTNRLQLSIR